MHLFELIYGISVHEKEIPDLEIKNVTTSKELIDEDTLFVLFRGIKFDTEKIINDIISLTTFV